jgi:PadR family transcriptional regulator, regulatory protein PadR
MTDADRKVFTREILLGFWKVHILHHATREPVVGQWILAELRRHGYDVSPGTLYPLLKRMEQNAWLKCRVDLAGGPRARRYYRITPRGRSVLRHARDMVSEMHEEVVAAEGPSSASRRHPRRAHVRRAARPSRSHLE